MSFQNKVTCFNTLLAKMLGFMPDINIFSDIWKNQIVSPRLAAGFPSEIIIHSGLLTVQFFKKTYTIVIFCFLSSRSD